MSNIFTSFSLVWLPLKIFPLNIFFFYCTHFLMLHQILKEKAPYYFKKSRYIYFFTCLTMYFWVKFYSLMTYFFTIYLTTNYIKTYKNDLIMYNKFWTRCLWNSSTISQNYLHTLIIAKYKSQNQIRYNSKIFMFRL